jgi:DHA1 family bicyclomycin/chloramphenicol resistance-like MFS transporter
MAASAFCAMSPGVASLTALRFVQALGGCAEMVIARAIVRDLYTGARAGRELSIMASVMALGPVLAPIVGGLLQTAFGWRSIFIALLVFGLMGVAAVLLLLPETLRERTQERFSLMAMLKSFGVVLRSPVFLAYLALGASSFAGLVVWLTSSAFVLQNLYGLTPIHFGLVFALGAVGYMSGTAFAARGVAMFGLDRVIGLGGAAQALGGIIMVVGLVVVPQSEIPLILAAPIYVAGMGMVQPQSIAGALSPFPERAGAASSLFGFSQMSVAAIAGAVIGMLMGQSAWPVAIMIAGFGCATLILWFATRGIRLRAVKS